MNVIQLGELFLIVKVNYKKKKKICWTTDKVIVYEKLKLGCQLGCKVAREINPHPTSSKLNDSFCLCFVKTSSL